MLEDLIPARDELVDFSWEVARDGYRVIGVVPGAVQHTNAEAPDLLAGQVYEDPDQAMAEEAERRGLPPHVVEVVTTVEADPSRLWVRPYAPLRDEPALFRTFADLTTTPDAIVSFADRYGLLGGSVKRELVMEEPDRMWIGRVERVASWRDEIAAMRSVVQAWDRARRGEPHGSPRWQRPDKVRKVYRSGLCQNAAALIRRARAPELLPNVQRAINAKLAAETGARMLWNREEVRLRLHLRPASLLGALWLQLAQAIDGNADYRRCEVCAAWIELRPNRTYCSNACRFKAYRARQGRARELHSAGMAPEDIAHGLGSDVETIRKWTGGSDG